MSPLWLLVISGGGAFAVIWLIQYIPLYKEVFGKAFSPRLIFCKALAPFDAVITAFLTFGTWLGISTAVGGIGMMGFGVLTSLGISAGVVVTKKFFIPRWIKQFDKLKEAQRRALI